MTTTPCTHPWGDYITGTWVCAKCYVKLHDRPQKISHEIRPTGSLLEDKPPRTRSPLRQRVVKCPIARAENRTFGDFVKLMAMRLVAKTKGGFDMSQAEEYALCILRGFEAEFGDKEYAWDEAGAFELVDEDMSYWDSSEEGGGNS